jgi:predicted N-acetyltransferase YhbS
MSPADAQRITGRCLCAAVRFEITGRLGPAIYCHCSQCRRASGSAFAANASVRARYLRFASGRDAIREFESTPGKFRAFCSRCGSPVYSRLASDPETFRIRLGTLDGDPGRRPLSHFWVGSKAAWHAITDALPQFTGDAPAAADSDGDASGALVLRSEAASDFDAIDAVHTHAFGRPGEAALVRALRREARPYLGLVAEQAGAGPTARVVGHVAFSPVAIDGGSPPALGLGPLAVEPSLQRRGIGSALLRAGLERCAAFAQIVVVLGHPEYYPRFGFRPAAPLGLRYRSEVFDASFFVLELAPGALAGISGWVRYPEAFERL